MDKQEIISEYMREIGSRTSDAKKASSARNSRLSSATQPGRVVSAETRERMRAGQARRRALEQSAK